MEKHLADAFDEANNLVFGIIKLILVGLVGAGIYFLGYKVSIYFYLLFLPFFYFIVVYISFKINEEFSNF